MSRQRTQHETSSSPLAGKRVVIVEDEGITQMQLRSILTRAEMLVVGAAANGADGVEVVLRQKPDLVLMDIIMPVMNGIEATKQILASFLTCIIMLTAISDTEIQEQAQAAGICGYVVKPVSSDTLLPEIEAAYHSFSASNGKGKQE
jgi:AmiR/NasT family two-component response regulator